MVKSDCNIDSNSTNSRNSNGLSSDTIDDFPDPMKIIQMSRSENKISNKNKKNKRNKKDKHFENGKINNFSKSKCKKSSKNDIETFANDSFDESESEDEDAILLSKILDAQTQEAIKALRTNDPKIYDTNYDFIKYKNDDNDNDNDNTIANTDTNDNDSNKNKNDYQWVSQCDNENDDQFLKKYVFCFDFNHICFVPFGENECFVVVVVV